MYMRWGILAVTVRISMMRGSHFFLLLLSYSSIQPASSPTLCPSQNQDAQLATTGSIRTILRDGLAPPNGSPEFLLISIVTINPATGNHLYPVCCHLTSKVFIYVSIILWAATLKLPVQGPYHWS